MRLYAVISNLNFGAQNNIYIQLTSIKHFSGVLSTIVWSIIIAIFGVLSAAGYYMKETSVRWANEGLKEDHEVRGM